MVGKEQNGIDTDLPIALAEEVISNHGENHDIILVNEKLIIRSNVLHYKLKRTGKFKKNKRISA
jgi:hypothetical protein